MIILECKYLLPYYSGHYFRDISFNVPLLHHGVDIFQAFMITVKDQHLFLSAKAGLRALDNIRNSPVCMLL